MADGGVKTQYLHNLKERLTQLGSACVALDTFFANGADRIAREADVKRLQNLTTRLKQYLEEAVSSENGAQSASIQVGALSSIGELIFKGIGSAMGEHARVEAFEKVLIARRAGRQYCFGMIMVCVGKGGLPDDVYVVSISKLARTQNREESEIIRELQQRGELLFSPEAFPLMIDALIDKLREGKLRLPISPEQLPAELAIPTKITVEFPLSVQPMPQLPPGKGTSIRDKGNLPTDK